MTVDEASGPAVELWPDNVLSVNAFIAMSTQWRTGMNGATGLDYNALPFVMRMVGVEASDRAGVFDDIRTMEQAALCAMHEDKQ